MDASNSSVIAVVGQHWLLGRLQLFGSRVLDFLQDERRSCVDLFDASIYRQADGEYPSATAPRLVVPKDCLDLVINREARHEAPIKRFNNRMVRATTDVFVVLGDYYVRGTLHLPSQSGEVFDFRTLQTQLGWFFPITDALLHGPHGYRREAAVLFANQNLISTIYFGDAARVESSELRHGKRQ